MWTAVVFTGRSFESGGGAPVFSGRKRQGNGRNCKDKEESEEAVEEWEFS
jgi:hypothetical protein